MDLLNGVLYHLSCPSCGADWWDNNAFPSYCPYCNTNRVPEVKGQGITRNVFNRLPSQFRQAISDGKTNVSLLR